RGCARSQECDRTFEGRNRTSASGYRGCRQCACQPGLPGREEAAGGNRHVTFRAAATTSQDGRGVAGQVAEASAVAAVRSNCHLVPSEFEQELTLAEDLGPTRQTYAGVGPFHPLRPTRRDNFQTTSCAAMRRGHHGRCTRACAG